jgi:hypothetical protein
MPALLLFLAEFRVAGFVDRHLRLVFLRTLAVTAPRFLIPSSFRFSFP